MNHRERSFRKIRNALDNLSDDLLFIKTDKTTALRIILGRRTLGINPKCRVIITLKKNNRKLVSQIVKSSHSDSKKETS